MQKMALRLVLFLGKLG